MSTDLHRFIQHAGETFELDPDGTAHWAREKTLFVADTHFGKTAAFRAGGVPVPEHTTARDLARLAFALERTSSERLVILGDMLHAKASRSAPVLSAFESFRAGHASLNIVLVRGNHDRSAGDPPVEWNIEVVDPMTRLGPFTLLHEPPELPGAVVGLDDGMAGHLHPSVRLIDPGTRSGVRVACFWKRSDCIVLPGFGSFTGTHVVRPAASDDVRVCTSEGVFAIGAV
ncbi:MAG: ligase-associated DNA damage response endonuclease PdeM [Phycisphaerales bacterium]